MSDIEIHVVKLDGDATDDLVSAIGDLRLWFHFETADPELAHEVRTRVGQFTALMDKAKGDGSNLSKWDRQSVDVLFGRLFFLYGLTCR